MDILFSCLFTALAAVHLAASASGLPSTAAGLPWALHLLAAALPAALAWQTPHWWENPSSCPYAACPCPVVQ